MSARPVQTSNSTSSAERLVARAVRRAEDVRFVTGRSCFVARELPLSATNIARWIRESRAR